MLQPLKQESLEKALNKDKKCSWYDEDCNTMTGEQIFLCATNIFKDFDCDIDGHCPVFK